MQVPEAIGRALADHGVDVFFGLVGSGNFTVTNALHAAGASYYSARHEGGAVMMADGYARACGKVGVLSVHQGPGFTNTLTGLTEAAKSRTPLLVLAADTPAEALWSNFKIDQAALATTAGAIAERVRGTKTAAEDVVRALRRTQVERRPVVLNIPINVVEGSCADDSLASPDWPVLEPPLPSERSVAEVAELLASSDWPVIVAGRGAALAGAREALEALGDQVGALLATSAVGHGLFAGHPYCVGIAGGFSSSLAVQLLSEADVVLAFDAAQAAWAIVGELDQRDVRREGFRSKALAREIATQRWRDETYEDRGTADYIDPRTLTIALDDLLPMERTVATDSGHFLGYPSMYLEVPDQHGFVFPQAFQSVGLGLASGVGAAVARPDRLSVAAIGDGGALMALGELETAARYHLPMVVVIYNDAAYGAEVHHFGPMGHPVDLTRFPDTDFAALARAAGAEGITVRRSGEISPIKGWLQARDGPPLIDAKVNPDVRAEGLREGVRVP